jgi:hypothetical protein
MLFVECSRNLSCCFLVMYCSDYANVLLLLEHNIKQIKLFYVVFGLYLNNGLDKLI